MGKERPKHRGRLLELKKATFGMLILHQQKLTITSMEFIYSIYWSCTSNGRQNLLVSNLSVPGYVSPHIFQTIIVGIVQIGVLAFPYSVTAKNPPFTMIFVIGPQQLRRWVSGNRRRKQRSQSYELTEWICYSSVQITDRNLTRFFLIRFMSVTKRLRQ